MKGFSKLLGWLSVAPALAAFFLSVGAALHVRSSVADGALEADYGPCRMVKNYQSNPHVMNHVDSAMWRKITGLPAQDEALSSWRIRGIYTVLGLKLAYSPERRREMILPKLEALPLCERA